MTLAALRGCMIILGIAASAAVVVLLWKGPTTMDKAQLMAVRLPEGDVEIPGVGTVRVRALNRIEAILVQQAKEQGTAVAERKVLKFGMVDPALTEADAERWQEAAPAGEIEPVTTKIAELSGMLEDSAKAAYKSNGSGPDDGVRAVPGAEIGDDEGAATGGDAG